MQTHDSQCFSSFILQNQYSYMHLQAPKTQITSGFKSGCLH